MLVKDVDEKEVEVKLKKLTLRKFREVLEVVESIAEAKKRSETIELIEQGLSLVIDGFNPDENSFDYSAALDIIRESIAMHQPGGSDRKKSD
jgi:hypothetical protein